MYHAHIVFIWICFVTAWIWIRWFRSSTSAQHSNWQTSTQKRIIHRRQMDATDTTGENHDSHHIYAMQLVSVFYGCDSFFYKHEQTCRRLCRCIGKRETKASSLHRTGCENTYRSVCQHVDNHAVLPPEYQAGGDSKAWKLVSARFWKSEPHDVRSIKLWSTGSGWSIKLQLLQKILQVRRKFIFIQILMEKITSASSTILQITSRRAPREHEFHNRVLSSLCVRLGEYLINLQDFPVNVAIWSQFTSDCLWLSSWLTKDEQTFLRNTRFDTVRATTSKHIDRLQRRIQHANLAGLEHISLVKKYVVLSDPAPTLIKMKVHVFSDAPLCVGVSNPDPSNNWTTKLEDVWNEHGFVENWSWQPQRCNSFGTYHQVLPHLTSRNKFRHNRMGWMQ